MVTFLTDRDPLLDAVKRVCSVVDDKSPIPILGNLLISADIGSRVTITGTNIDVCVDAFVPAEITEAGSFTLLAHPFSKAVSHSVGAEARLTEDGQCWARFTIGKSIFRAQTTSAAEFPAIEMATREATIGFELPAGFFAAVKRRHAYVIDAKDARLALGGIGFFVDGDRLVVLSGASYGASISELPLPAGATGMPAFILPADHLDWFADTEGKSETRLEVSNWFVRLSSPQGRITSRLLESVYPDIRESLPADRRMKVRFDRKEACKALLRAEVYADARNRVVRLAFSPDLLTVETADGSFGSASSEIATDGDFTLAIGFAARPLRLCLESFDSEVIEMAFGERRGPSVICDPADATRTVMAMPYWLRDDVAVVA